MAAAKRPIDDPRLQLVPASGRSRLWLWLLGVVLPIALSGAVSLIARPATSSADLFASDWRTRLSAGFNLPDQLLGPLFVAGVTLAICLLLDRMLRRQRLRLDRNGFEVVTTFYRQRLALSQLQLDRARVIELGEHPELRPWLKSNGFALPGFRSGWFRTRGFKKLFLATAGGQRLLWLPTTRGDALLLQPQRPQALLERLREMARPPSAR
jgi:hypothetical protein